MVLHRRVNLMLAASDIDNMPSRKLLRIEVTPDSHQTYNENGGNRELVLNIADKYIPLVKCKAYFNCVSYFLPDFRAEQNCIMHIRMYIKFHFTF